VIKNAILGVFNHRSFAAQNSIKRGTFAAFAARLRFKSLRLLLGNSGIHAAGSEELEVRNERLQRTRHGGRTTTFFISHCRNWLHFWVNINSSEKIGG